MERALRNSSKTRDPVLDPFGGSGTTIIACEKSGRKARVIELDPKYRDVAIRRWQSYAGQVARHEESGHAFDDGRQAAAHGLDSLVMNPSQGYAAGEQ